MTVADVMAELAKFDQSLPVTDYHRAVAGTVIHAQPAGDDRVVVILSFIK